MNVNCNKKIMVILVWAKNLKNIVNSFCGIFINYAPTSWWHYWPEKNFPRTEFRLLKLKCSKINCTHDNWWQDGSPRTPATYHWLEIGHLKSLWLCLDNLGYFDKYFLNKIERQNFNVTRLENSKNLFERTFSVYKVQQYHSKLNKK